MNTEKYSPSYRGQQGSRHNHQFGRTTTKYTWQPPILRLYRQSCRTTERESHGLLSLSPPSLPVPQTLPPSIFLSSSEEPFVLNKLPWLNKVCSLAVPLPPTERVRKSDGECLCDRDRQKERWGQRDIGRKSEREWGRGKEIYRGTARRGRERYRDRELERGAEREGVW